MTSGAHPNVLAAVMAPEARRLSRDRSAASERWEVVKAMDKAGEPRAAIAARFGISTSRVGQLLAKGRKRQS